MEGKDPYEAQRFYRGGRFGRGQGRGWRDETQHADTQFQGRWDDRRDNFQEGRHVNQQWRQRESGRDVNQNLKKEQMHFDLRQNLNQGR
jgi:alkanesulfonate monooxygenase SsuD/methylene tetrahydromethanopterin reductase-like flavin-dependent oxidoreductase (luciferase family)